MAMKTAIRYQTRVAIVLTALLATTSCLVSAAEENALGYTLFMGADLAVQHGKDFYRVDDIAGGDFVVHVGGKEERIPTDNASSRMRIDRALKLGGASVVLDKMTTERSYTPAKDPRLKFRQMSGMASGASAVSDLAAMEYQASEAALASAKLDPYAPAAAVQAAQRNLENATTAQNQSYVDQGSDNNSTGSRAHEMQMELAKENYDAIRISMDVSSPVPLDDPYLLIIARIHERGEKADVFRNWIFAQKIDPIGQTPVRLNINQGGMPIGYSLDECQVRIYNHGREVPTSQSPKRVDLTPDQARQYVMIEFLAAHRGDTVPAAPVLSNAPGDLKQRLLAGDFAQPFFVRVDPEGNASGTFADKECKRATDDPYVQSVVSNMIFTPALEKGHPVSGVARLQLGSLLN